MHSPPVSRVRDRVEWPTMTLFDQHQRPLRNLRLSVTDRCNLRCQYCMPEENYTWFPHREILQYEECGQLVDVFTSLGVNKVRLTGGEPLLRRDLHLLIRQLAERPAIEDLALTTNGILLEDRLGELAEAGLGRITVSLDTLKPERFQQLTRSADFDRVVAGIRAVGEGPLARDFKLDTVVMRGVNDDELLQLLDFGAEVGAEVRFIEFMDVGGATTWSKDKVVSRADMLSRIEKALGPAEPLSRHDSAPADRYRLADGRIFGIISSTTQPFCGSCDRSRLTADGRWFLCLYATEGLDLKTPLRAGASPDDLAALIQSSWESRTNRGAEERLLLNERGALADADAMRKNPHLEMHTRGG